MPPFTDFCENGSSSFYIILLTNKQTNLHRWKHNLLGRGKKRQLPSAEIFTEHCAKSTNQNNYVV